MVMINIFVFHSQKRPGLNEKLYIHPRVDLEGPYKQLTFTMNEMESIGEIFVKCQII